MSSIKDIVEMLQALATVVAVIVGGTWGLRVYYQKRQKYPRASLEHSVMCKPLAGKVLFHVTVVVRNTGDVLLSLVWSQTRVQQVLPLIPQVMASIDNCENFVDDAKIHDPRIEIGWCQLGSHRINFEENQCDIEPGESEEIHHDFKLDPGVNTIAVYTYVKNRARDKHDLGWNLTTFQDLGDTAGTSLDEGGNKSNGEERIDCAEGDPGENPGVGRVTSSSEARDRTGPTS